ncbi:MAG: aminopeptidase [Candidatus Izemoplasmatales bacterium]|uniref:Aminopeptidase n=1 Tax=Hujiaoplasma nucleasis TaxID=2725268 RepID=A0A7L6N7D4_9MOLU|nr:aminopeptidase [Hujiaoplasma nucleasis]QLY40885.1 aminopeptidase [Hujiaoplasma nucleasis]
MPKEILIDKLANLSVQVGANVQKDQVVVVNASTETRDIARKVVEKAYQAGAKEVIVNWRDEYTGKMAVEYQSIESLENIPEYAISRYKYFVDNGACVISIVSPIPGLNKDLDPKKQQAQAIASSKALNFYREHMMGNRSQWTIIAASNPIWAKKVFPNLDEDQAVEALWDAIFKASRVSEDNDPVEEWLKHNSSLIKHNQILNDYQFKSLYFKNALGTDLKVDLVNNHVWSGGQEEGTNGVVFNPNIPTEENFTMPLKTGVNGKVVATKPLDYQGNLIEDFWLEFKDGKVVNYDAKEGKENLKNLIEFDEGSSYLGEVALISHNSPISQSNILFFNTLFDENASCHLALGRAYPMNIQGGTEMSKEELAKHGYNNSMAHVDFMFGSEDMDIVGESKDGKKVQIFKDGNFVI